MLAKTALSMTELILWLEASLLEKMTVSGLPCDPPSSRTCSCYLRHTDERQLVLQKTSKIKSILFVCFVNENMLKQVIKHTNERARKDLRKRGKNPDKWVPVD